MVNDKMFLWFERIFTAFGMSALPQQSKNSLPAKIGQVSGMIFLLMTLFALELTSFIYMWNHAMIGDIENALYASFQVDAVIGGICCTITIILHSEKVRKVFDMIKESVDQGNNRETVKFCIHFLEKKMKTVNEFSSF